MKNNKGISLVTLVVMIIIIIILAAITINATMSGYEKSIEAREKVEREQLIKAVTGRFADYQRNNTSNPMVGILIPEENLDTKENAVAYICDKLKNEYQKFNIDKEEKDKQTESIEKFVSDNFEHMDYTRILEYSDLISLDMENANVNVVYIVNYYSSDVVGPIN